MGILGLKGGVYVYTIGRQVSMPRPRPSGPRKTFQLKLTPEESERWQKTFDRARERNHYINETQVNRILLGLDDDPATVTERERIYFRGIPGKPGMLGHTALSKSHIHEVAPAKKKRK